LVEDDALVRYSLARVLNDAGYEVIEAVDGLDGVRKFKSGRPQLVIADILMPEQDGIGLINELLRIDKEARVLAISGGGEIMGMDYLQMATQLGAKAILAKPFENAALLDKISTILQGSADAP